MQEFNIFFHAYYNKIVTWSDRMEFVNGWYILIIISDTLTIAGSALKIGIQTKVYFSLSIIAYIFIYHSVFYNMIVMVKLTDQLS